VLAAAGVLAAWPVAPFGLVAPAGGALDAAPLDAVPLDAVPFDAVPLDAVPLDAPPASGRPAPDAVERGAPPASARDAPPEVAGGAAPKPPGGAAPRDVPAASCDVLRASKSWPLAPASLVRTESPKVCHAPMAMAATSTSRMTYSTVDNPR